MADKPKSDTPADYDDWDYDNGFVEEDYDEYEDCGMMPDGQCTLAGSEWCDWDCPRNRGGGNA
ncbi:hypothetical protein GCM10007989_07790 [Devosia pacifica]|uniref:Uncharacterized protein n=1 Tax=Devosia pacifica TaxID=1335967 RepID=A0A918RY97_9HYPH|nr:hypothetical protein [Devosia pacifica]GHA15460.1 hypothetical protein GCM10007989_07790 [Devosia pacifica]